MASICDETGCGKPAAYRVEVFGEACVVCLEHARELMGLLGGRPNPFTRFIPLPGAEAPRPAGGLPGPPRGPPE